MIKSNRLLIKYIRTKFYILSKISKKYCAKKAFDLFCTPFFKVPELHASSIKYAEALNFKLNGLNVKGYRWNKGGVQRVLIIHGFSSGLANFYHFVTPLTSKNLEVLAFDAPAHGASEGKRLNTVIYSDMIKMVIELFGPIEYFITHSYGGLALCLALEQLPGNERTKAVLIAPASENSTAVEGAFKLLGMNDQGVQKEFNKLIYKVSGNPINWFSIKRALPNIKAKILWIHDEKDDVTPITDAKTALAGNPPNVKFIITNGLGHRKIYRDPTVVNTVISFLENG